MKGVTNPIEAQQVFDYLITQQREQFSFEGRQRRPPTDPVNGLLSFVYTLLRRDCESALEGVGLDPAVGFLHRDRPGRASLALDLMEEMRPYLADRLTLSLINKRRVRAGGFTKDEAGAVRMDDDTRKLVIRAYQQRKCTAPGFLDSGLTVFASTLPRPARGGRVAPGPGFGSRTSPASTARCTSA